MFNSEILKDKVALVTGASRGIGKSIATTLGNMGAFVIGTATSENGAAELTKYFEANNIKGIGVSLNLIDAENIENLVKEITKEHGAPLILINNAGITQDNLLMRMKDSEWQSVIDTNLTGTFKLTKACLRGMMKAKWGRIINISSVVAFAGNPGQANYCASKAALVAFAKSLALEIASRNITVNTVAPGFINTDMTKVLPEEQKQALNSRIPVGYCGEPEDIAAAVGFLSSPAASYITGETIHVNGGMYMA